MFTRKKFRFFLIFLLAVVFYLISFPFNEWFSYTMPRHQIMQLPLAFGIGIGFTFLLPHFSIPDLSWGISGLIFILGSLILWMLPHSVDKTIIYPYFNRIMLLNMVFCGILLTAIYRKMLLEVRIFFLGMLSAKFVAIGIVMRVFNIPLCSSFSIDQQWETGIYFILIGATVFIGAIIYFFKSSTSSP